MSKELLKEKIINGLKEISKLANEKEIILQECADILNDTLIDIEDLIDAYKREKSPPESFGLRNIKITEIG
jgi:hypothetical protein